MSKPKSCCAHYGVCQHTGPDDLPTCDELGYCQRNAVRFPFAPGTIDYGPTLGTPREWATELIAASIAVAAVFAVIGFALGFIKLPGWLL